MGNTTEIDELVDPVAIAQIVNLKTESKSLRDEMVLLLETSIKLNNTLGGSTPATFTKNLKASNEATDKLIANSNKQIELENKKAAAQEAAVNKYLVLLSKQQAERDKADAKEIAAAEKKAAKLQAIADKTAAEQARKANVQFPASQTPYNQVTEDTGNVRYEPVITGNEDMTSASTQATAALNAETGAIAAQAIGFADLTEAQRLNATTLLELSAERAANAIELKELNIQDAVSGERAIFLTSEQIRLSIAISQTTLTLKQLAKQEIAVDTSGAQMQARLDEIRVLIGNLSQAELENIEIGGVLIAEAGKLDIAIKELRGSTGDMSKNVGDYTNSINKSSAGMQLGDRIANQFTRSIIRMGVQFVLIGLIFGAASWLYDFIKGLDIFTGRLDQATQDLKALNQVQKDAAEQAGQIVGKYRILRDTVNDLSISYKDRLLAAKELKKLWPEELENSSAQAIANGTETKSLDKLTESVVKLAKAKAAATQIEKTEGEIIALQIQQDKVNSAKSDELDKNAIHNRKNFENTLQFEAQRYGHAKYTQDQLDKLYKESQNKQTDNARKGTIDRANIANKDINDQIALKDKTIKKLEQYGGLKNEAEVIEKKTKDAKTPKPKDTANTELLEYYRLQLEETQKTSKIILDDDNQSFAARRVSLQVYLKASADLVKNAEAVALADKNISNQKRKNIELDFHNKLLDVQRQGIVETEKLAKEELEKQKKNLQDLLTASKESEQEQLEILDNASKLALFGLTKAKDDKVNALSLERAEGKISEKKYQEELLAIDDQFAIDRIAQEIATQQAILAAKEGHRDASVLTARINGASPAEIAKIQSEGDKDVQPTKDTIADLGEQFVNATTRQTVHKIKTTTKDSDQDKKAIEQEALDFTIAAIDTVDKLRQAAYENEIQRLENEGKLIDENAQIQKNRVQGDLDTQVNKARRLADIDAQAASAHKALQERENQEKRKEAIADKEATVAKLIAQGALAVVTALTAPPGIAQVLAVITAATVGVELAKAIATPIPSYFKGTGTGTHPGGLARVGEKGIEAINEPGKPTYYSPGVATIVDLPKYTTITPHNMLPDTPKWTQNRTDNSDVVAAVNENTRVLKAMPKQQRQRLSGWAREQRQLDVWNNYSSNHFR